MSFEILTHPEYDFLKNDSHLGKRVALLAYGGSHAYGTNIETSDVDMRGFFTHSKEEILGLGQFEPFEQYVDENTDTTIYSFNKFIKLLLNCNPNAIEILGCKPEHYAFKNQFGQILLDNRKLFLSQIAIKSFGEYANQQLRRFQNALAHDHLSQTEKELHVANVCKSSIKSFNDRYMDFDKNSMRLFVCKSAKSKLESEIFIDLNLNKYPLRDLRGIISEFLEIIKNYDKLNNRNKKKDNLHLNKHAMHLVRLYLECLDILKLGDIFTYRASDLPLLMDIRFGKFQKADETFDSSFYDLINELQKELEIAAQNTSLPLLPNYEMVSEIMMDINLKSILE